MVCGTQVHLVHPILHVYFALSDDLQFERQKMLGSYCGVCRAWCCCLFHFSACRVDEGILFTFCGLAEYPACREGEGTLWIILRACRAVEIDPLQLSKLLCQDQRGGYRYSLSPFVLGNYYLFSIVFLQSFLAYCLGLWRVLVCPCLVTMLRQAPCSGPLRLALHRPLSPSPSPLIFATGRGWSQFHVT